MTLFLRSCLPVFIPFALCSFCVSFISFLFGFLWVSSLAYPNLLGIKGYVVVVVVVVAEA